MLSVNPIIITDLFGDFLYPRNKHYPLTQSWEMGGVALNDTSQGLDSYVWQAWIDGSTVYLKRDDDTVVHTVLHDDNITEIDVSFDQNMNVCVAYVSNGKAKLYFYDTQIADYNTVIFDDIKHPRISLDDKRAFNIANSNLIFAYIKDNKLCMRLQNERFGVEHELQAFNDNKVLWRIGMGNANRFLFYVR